jgi:hypothetical protein
MSDESAPHIVNLGGADDGAQGQRDTGFMPPPEPPPKQAPRTSPNMRRMHDELTGMYAGLGMMVVGAAEMKAQAQAGNPAAVQQAIMLRNAGVNTVKMAEGIADSWIKLANENAAVKRTLERVLEVSTVGTLVAQHGMLLLPYGIALGWVPEIIMERFGASVFAGAAPNGNGA